MKEISGIDPLERTVRDDPSQLPARIDEIRDRLDAENREARMDAARALRAAAEADAALVEPHRETIRRLLDEGNDSIRLSGAIAVAELAESDPELVAGAVSDLVAVMEDTEAPAIDVAAIRALARIAEVDPDAVAGADPVVAERVQSATVHVRGAVVSVFAGAITGAPSQFPRTVAAVEEAVATESGALQRHAALTVAEVAKTDPTALSSLDRAERSVAAVADRIRADPRPFGEDVVEAAGTLRELRDERAG